MSRPAASAPALPVAASWLALTAVALLTRPLLPVDETRYLGVAWEMWARGDLLVPHLNGAPYADKPPLLFWLMHLGWGLFGVREGWARLVVPLTGALALVLTARTGRALWPASPAAGPLAALVLVAALYWSLLATVTLFDVPLTVCVLVAIGGVLRAARGGEAGGWALVALGLGLGVLAKGPAVLVSALPVALFAPLWAPARPSRFPSWRRWYLGLAAALAGAGVLALAWAVPAAMRGGEDYADAIFWGQTAGRIVDSFAHRRPWWWYAVVIGPMLLPWSAWPTAWRAVAKFGRGACDPGARFAAIWFLGAFLLFSTFSGKQPHYLLPALPAVALLVARALLALRGPTRPWERTPPALVIGAVGLAIVLFPIWRDAVSLPEWTASVRPGWGFLPLGAAVGLAAWPSAEPARAARRLAGGSVALVVGVHLALGPGLRAGYDVGPVAERVSGWQAAGRPVANLGKYHGQYHFAGRLASPLDELLPEDGRGAADAWALRHPAGRLVTYPRVAPDDAALPLHVQPYRSRLIVVWDASVITARPEVLDPVRPPPGAPLRPAATRGLPPCAPPLCADRESCPPTGRASAHVAECHLVLNSSGRGRR